MTKPKKPEAEEAQAADNKGGQPWDASKTGAGDEGATGEAAQQQDEAEAAVGGKVMRGDQVDGKGDTAKPWEEAAQIAAGERPATGYEIADANLRSPQNKAATITDANPAFDQDAMQARFAELSDDERDELNSHMTAEAARQLDRIERNRAAKDLEVNMVEGSRHYGKKIVPNRPAQESE